MPLLSSSGDARDAAAEREALLQDCERLKSAAAAAASAAAAAEIASANALAATLAAAAELAKREADWAAERDELKTQLASAVAEAEARAAREGREAHGLGDERGLRAGFGSRGGNHARATATDPAVRRAREAEPLGTREEKVPDTAPDVTAPDVMRVDLLQAEAWPWVKDLGTADTADAEPERLALELRPSDTGAKEEPVDRSADTGATWKLQLGSMSKRGAAAREAKARVKLKQHAAARGRGLRKRSVCGLVGTLSWMGAKGVVDGRHAPGCDGTGKPPVA